MRFVALYCSELHCRDLKTLIGSKVTKYQSQNFFCKVTKCGCQNFFCKVTQCGCENSVVKSFNVAVKVSVAKSRSVGVTVSFVKSQSAGVKLVGTLYYGHSMSCISDLVFCILYSNTQISYSAILFCF